MKLLSVIALAVSGQDVLSNPADLGAAAADAIAGDAELNALLNEYQASAPPAPPSRGAAAFGRSGGGFDMQALLGGRQLPPGMNLMDFITPQGTFDTMAFLFALKAALVAQAAAAPATAAPTTTTTTTTTEAAVIFNLDELNDFLYTYDASDDYSYDAVKSSDVASTNTASFGGNRPSNAGAEVEAVKTFIGDYDADDSDEVAGTTTNFKGCRICTDMTAEDCAAEPITECYPYFDYETDDRACQVTMRSRWTRGGSQYGGTVETLYTSRCVTPQACEDDARQNFVPNALKTNASKYFAMNQCKRTDKLSRRFVHSECTMCLKLATDDATEWNALFPGGDDTLAFRTTVGDSDPASFTTITELLSAPETYMFSNHDENVANDNHPLGQSYDKMQSYNIANTP